MKAYIQTQLEAAFEIKRKLLEDPSLIDLIQIVVARSVQAFQSGNKILAAGNGGSAADAQHIVAEFVSRFYFDRPALAAEALSVNTSILTAIGNDYGYEQLFARQIEANARAGDVFFALSTSGNSPNILLAAQAARQKGLTVVGFTGQLGGKLAALCDFCFKAPSSDTPRIQEVHILIGHVICAAIEIELFGSLRK